MRPVLEEALASTRRLHETVEEVLRLARLSALPHQPVPDTSIARLLAEIQQQWHGLFAEAGRRMDCATRDVEDDVLIPRRPVAEILGVLLDKAHVHGHGGVRVAVRDLDEALAFEAADEGAPRVDPLRLFARGQSLSFPSGLERCLVLRRSPGGSPDMGAAFV